MEVKIMVCLLVLITTMARKASGADSSNDPLQLTRDYVDKMANQAADVLKCDSIRNNIFFSPLVYNQKRYFVSKFAHQDVDNANFYCKNLGGYLAEIDDVSEYTALKNLVLSLPFDLVVVAGSDAQNEGTWIFPRTGKPVPVLDWAPGQPDNFGGAENCLNLWKYQGGRMNDITCGFRNPDVRFICETPQ